MKYRLDKQTRIVIVLPNSFAQLDRPVKNPYACVFESYGALPKERLIVSEAVTTQQKEVSVAIALKTHPEHKDALYKIIKAHGLSQTNIEESI
jgi:hypothetical protein